MRGNTTAEKLQIFHSDFEKLKKNREAMPLPELLHRCGKAYKVLVAQVLEGADWYADAFLCSHACAFPLHPWDTAGNKWLDGRVAAILREEDAPGGLVGRYRAALIDRLDMEEFKQLVWERYERLRREAYEPYWMWHCRRLESGWIYNDYSGWDARFPPQIKEESNANLQNLR